MMNVSTEPPVGGLEITKSQRYIPKFAQYFESRNRCTALRICIAIIIFANFHQAYGQEAIDAITKSYCNWKQPCSIKKNNPIHFAPYSNGLLCENFNPKQPDFSKQFFDLRTKRYAKTANKLQQLLKYDFSPVLLTKNDEQNGVLGLSYQRIRFHIDSAIKISDSLGVYSIFGKSKVNNVILNFSGEVNVLKIFHNDCDDPALKQCAELFASYTFYEDSTKNYSGVFRGVMECSIYLETTNAEMFLDKSSEIADGYRNRTFVGTWTAYKSKQPKKCIWGDYRLPFTFDFDCGDGEMRVCEQYEKNGWLAFNGHTERIENSEDKWELMNKWWIANGVE